MATNGKETAGEEENKFSPISTTEPTSTETGGKLLFQHLLVQ